MANLQYVKTSDAISIFMNSKMKIVSKSHQYYDVIESLLADENNDAISFMLHDFDYSDDNMSIETCDDKVEMYFEGRYYTVPIVFLNCAKHSAFSSFTRKSFAVFLKSCLQSKDGLSPIVDLMQTHNTFITTYGKLAMIVDSDSEVKNNSYTKTKLLLKNENIVSAYNVYKPQKLIEFNPADVFFGEDGHVYVSEYTALSNTFELQFKLPSGIIDTAHDFDVTYQFVNTFYTKDDFFSTAIENNYPNKVVDRLKSLRSEGFLDEGTACALLLR